jgi:adenylate kinase
MQMHQSLRLVIFGPPGCGKGTQCPFLEEEFGVVHISTGDLLRKAALIPGSKIKKIIDSGNFVDDETILQMIQTFISSSPQCREKGFVLDGFPRTLQQAKAFDNNPELATNYPIDKVILLQINVDALVERVCGRLVHLASGRSYHATLNPPRISMTDDVTGEPLVKRADDNEQTLRKRLAIYLEKTAPLEEYYSKQGKLIRIDASLGVEEIREAIFKALKGK